jgi:type I restriction enzyme R subunit
LAPSRLERAGGGVPEDPDPVNEAETRAKLIDPAIHARGWSEDLIGREESAGTIDLGGRAPRRRPGRVDYTLRIKARADAQPVAVALIEAKADTLPPAHGLEQAKAYADAKRLNVPFVFSSNGHLFVEFDQFTQLTSMPRPMAQFPMPGDLRRRYEEHMGFSLDDPAAEPLNVRYSGGEASRRYYQDAPRSGGAVGRACGRAGRDQSRPYKTGIR